MAAAVLTGLLALLLGWLAALEGRLRADQPEGRGNRKGPLPSLIPTAPPTLCLSSVWMERQKAATAGGELGETCSAQEMMEGDRHGFGRASASGSLYLLASLLISMTSVTHWPRVFIIFHGLWSRPPAPAHRPPLSACCPPPRGIRVAGLLNYRPQGCLCLPPTSPDIIPVPPDLPPWHLCLSHPPSLLRILSPPLPSLTISLPFPSIFLFCWPSPSQQNRNRSNWCACLLPLLGPPLPAPSPQLCWP